ncbi:protein CDC73 homolog [Quercus suber]|uniref:protein CDC73 homolog n=1 Tax=Quercus suber TaxID=58331 RepID=UPI000CE2730A|nr:protein CDC73 homolog [Quercus suber]POE82962.1 protein cdc73 like [Quercus suber]
MDPLSAVRDYTIRNELDRIVRYNDEFRFGSDYSFPCSIETGYRSKQGNLYTLETLLFFINNHHLKHIEYIQKARTQGITAVTLPDRKPLLDYLTGKVSSSDSVQLNDVVNLNPQKFPDLPLNSSVIASEPFPPNFSEQNSTQLPEHEVVDFTAAMVTSMERPLKDRESLLECKQRDFYSVLVASTKREEERQRVESQQRKDGLVAKNRLMGSEETRYGVDESMNYDNSMTPKPKMMHLMMKGSKIGEGVPIILVPSAFQTLITIYNVKEFLEDGVFIPTDVKVKQMKGAKPDCVTVQKKFSRDRVVTAYEVRDKPSGLKPEDWDRVVAVFVLGKEWQFKDWPYKDHVEIFNKILGFFMRFEDDSLESAKTVKQWNVKIISISKNKRHQDRTAALDVWEKLEDFVRSRSHS